MTLGRLTPRRSAICWWVIGMIPTPLCVDSRIIAATFGMSCDVVADRGGFLKGGQEMHSGFKQRENRPRILAQLSVEPVLRTVEDSTLILRPYEGTPAPTPRRIRPHR